MHKLRPNVEVVRTGPGTYQLLDATTGNYYSLGAEERFLLYLLERADAHEDVSAAFEIRFGKPVNEAYVRRFVEHLSALGLLVGDAEPTDDVGREAAEKVVPAPPAPLSREDPGANRNFFFDLLVVLFGWILHPLVRIPTVLLVALALSVVVRNWDEMLLEMKRLWDEYPFLLYLLLFVVPKLLVLNITNCLLFGMACRCFGGRVDSFRLGLWEGVLPMFHVDVGDSMLKMDRSQRRRLLLLSMWFAITIAAACFVTWSVTLPGSGLATMSLLVVIACLIRVVVHANIFYGQSSLYLLLCDLTRNWQLGKAARAETRDWLLGSARGRSNPSAARTWLRLYGLCYYAYRGLSACLVLTIGYWLADTYDLVGAGAAIALICWWHRDLFQRPTKALVGSPLVGRG